MEQQHINTFISANIEKFDAAQLSIIRQQLEQLDDSKFMVVFSAEYRSPTLILVIAILLGWERFFLDDILMGVLKIITCYGCFIWWIVDICTATSRAKEYNFKKFQQVTML